MLRRSTEHTPGSPILRNARPIDPRLLVRTPQSGMSLLLARGTPAAPRLTRQRRSALRVKRWLDVIFSALALIALAPVLVLLAMALLVAQGRPVFVGRRRLGLNGKPFLLWDFHTRDDAGPTPIGTLVRNAGLDALPQLFNILAGDMSFVGPEAHEPKIMAAGMRYEALVPYYRMRLAMRPGLVGWAQINGHTGPVRDAGSARARIDHDVAYIQNVSPLLDARIIIQTLRH